MNGFIVTAQRADNSAVRLARSRVFSTEQTPNAFPSYEDASKALAGWLERYPGLTGYTNFAIEPHNDGRVDLYSVHAGHLVECDDGEQFVTVYDMHRPRDRVSVIDMDGTLRRLPPSTQVLDLGHIDPESIRTEA